MLESFSHSFVAYGQGKASFAKLILHLVETYSSAIPYLLAYFFSPSWKMNGSEIAVNTFLWRGHMMYVVFIMIMSQNLFEFNNNSGDQTVLGAF